MKNQIIHPEPPSNIRTIGFGLLMVLVFVTEFGVLLAAHMAVTKFLLGDVSRPAWMTLGLLGMPFWLTYLAIGSRVFGRDLNSFADVADYAKCLLLWPRQYGNKQ